MKGSAVSPLSSARRAPESSFSFSARLWKYDGAAGWCFVTLPKGAARRIRRRYQDNEEGWGRLRVTVTVGATTWSTSIWYDTKAASYLLPIKATARRAERLAIGGLIRGEILIVRASR